MRRNSTGLKHEIEGGTERVQERLRWSKRATDIEGEPVSE